MPTLVDRTRQTGEANLSRGGQDTRDELTIVEIYTVIADSVQDGAVSILGTGGLPRLGDPHPDVQGLICTSINPRRWTNRADYWSVVCTWEREFREDPDVEIDFDIHMTAIVGAITPARDATLSAHADAAGNVAGNPFIGKGQWGFPIVNSAEESYVPPPEDEDAYPTLRVSRNERLTKLDDFWDWTNRVNAKPFLGQDPRSWLLAMRGRPVPNSLGLWWRVDYMLRYNANLWDLQLLDQGRYYRANPGKPPTGAQIEFLDEEGNPRIGNLDGQGGALGDGLPPVYNRWERKISKDFAPLRLEDTIRRFYSQAREIQV